MEKLKVMTIVGTRPEIIRLAIVIKKCDTYFNQVLVHTGQNYDYALHQVFFYFFWLNVVKANRKYFHFSVANRKIQFQVILISTMKREQN